VFLFDVDNTLLDNDRVTADLKQHLETEVGHQGAQCYWSIFERLRSQLGYADYLGALQRYRSKNPHDPRLLAVSRFLIDYPLPGVCSRARATSWRMCGLGVRSSFCPMATWCFSRAKWTARDCTRRCGATC